MEQQLPAGTLKHSGIIRGANQELTKAWIFLQRKELQLRLPLQELFFTKEASPWAENVVVVIGPKWRLHYYAHLKNYNISFFDWLSKGEKLGEVGTTGNAKGNSPHLHYSMITLIPYPWRIDSDHQGWKKMFYLDPSKYFDDQ